MNLKLAIAAGTAILGAAGGVYHQEASHEGVKPLSLVRQGFNDVRGFQFDKPVFEGAPEEVEQKVNAALGVAMRQCLEKGKINVEEYLDKKSEWPADVQLKVRACCTKIANRDDTHFQFAIGDRSFDTKEGEVFFQKDIRCSSAAIVRPQQKEESADIRNQESKK